MAEQNLFLQALSEVTLKNLKTRLRTRDLRAGQVLFAAGDKIEAIYFPQSGAVSLVIELSDGQRIESAMVGRDGVVGGGAAIDDRDATHNAIVQMSGSGFSLDVETARQIGREHEEFRTALMRHEQLILAQAQQSAACNAAHNLEERLARWLLRTRDVTGGDAFELTQEFIAEMLGVRRTSVSLVAHTLQKAGLISYKRGHVNIDDPERLRATACECYGAVKTLYDQVLQRAIADNRALNPTGGARNVSRQCGQQPSGGLQSRYDIDHR